MFVHVGAHARRPGARRSISAASSNGQARLLVRNGRYVVDESHVRRSAIVASELMVSTHESCSEACETNRAGLLAENQGDGAACTVVAPVSNV